MVLGAQLRRLRIACEITREEAGDAIRASESKISRMELGRVGLKPLDVGDLLTLYGVHDSDEREPLLTLARKSREPGWWQEYGDVLPTWFEEYVGLESAASEIFTYEVQFVPGLLQTAEYARAIAARARELDHQGEVERHVRLRMARGKLLSRAVAPPTLWAILDEGALLRPIGGVRVMRDQIEALIDAVLRPNIRIQVVPFGLGGHAAESGAFAVLRFPGEGINDVVYVEQLGNAHYLNKPDDVTQYHATWDRLADVCPEQDHTPAILERIHRQIGE
jgi:transcriptional regulator with XRE-family HTH domain